MPRDLFQDSSDNSVENGRDLFAHENIAANDLAPYGHSGLGHAASYIADTARQFGNSAIIDPINSVLKGLANGANLNPLDLLRSQLSGQQTEEQAPQIPKYSMELEGTPTARAAQLTGDILAYAPSVYGAGKLGLAAGKALLKNTVNKPQVIAEGLVQHVTKGQSPEDIAKSLASDVKMAREEKESIGKTNFTKQMIENGDENLYSSYPRDPYTSKVQIPSDLVNKSYVNMNHDLIKEDSQLKDLHNSYIKDPTFENAHKLRIEFGRKERAIGRKLVTTGEEDKLQGSAIEGKKRLTNDINNHFRNIGRPEVAKQYENNLGYWRKNVVPYGKDKDIYEISHGENLNPKPSTLAKIFSRPDRNEDIQTIVSHLGPQSYDKIIATQIGKLQGSEIPSEVAKEILSLHKNKGFQFYKTPEQVEISKALGKALGAKENVKKIPILGRYVKDITDKTKTKKIAETLEQGL